MISISCIMGRLKERFLRTNDPLDCRNICTGRNDDHRNPEKFLDATKDLNKIFLVGQNTRCFKQIVNKSVHFFVITNLSISSRFDEYVPQSTVNFFLRYCG